MSFFLLGTGCDVEPHPHLVCDSQDWANVCRRVRGGERREWHIRSEFAALKTWSAVSTILTQRPLRWLHNDDCGPDPPHSSLCVLSGNWAVGFLQTSRN